MEILNGVLTKIKDEDLNEDGSFTFPKGVTEIAGYAFSEIQALRSLEVPYGVKKIGHNAFTGCAFLKKITLPRGLSIIGKNAFGGCQNLTNLEIPGGVEEIGYETFYGCKNLKSITLPKGLSRIDESAFSGCESLTNIVIPEGVEEIEYQTFYGCKNLKTITLPKGLIAIRGGAFARCTSLTSLEVPEGVEEIGNKVFLDCKNLKTITLPKTLTYISNGAFKSCENLTNIVIPEGVEEIEYETFDGCKNLKTITLPKTLTTIEEKAFNCSGLQSIKIPQGVQYIGKEAFYYCSKLKTVTLPKGLTEIGEDAFWMCESLTSIKIPEGVEEIGWKAFANCSKLKTVTLPKTLTTIQPCVFENCENLTNIEIPEGVEEIGWKAFANCSKLKTVILPKTLTTIGTSAFSGCDSLKSVLIPASVTQIELDAFSECPNLISLNIQNKIDLPVYFVSRLNEAEYYQEFINNSEFKFFRGSDLDILKDIKDPENFDSDDRVRILNYYKFLNAIGCFSKEKLIDKNGNETSTEMAQKATEWFLSVAKDKFPMTLFENNAMFKKLKVNAEPNQEFLKFISNPTHQVVLKEGKKVHQTSFENLDLLLELEEEFPGIFVKVMTNFDDVKKYRKIEKDGKTAVVPWREALKNYYTLDNFKNYTITDENKDIVAEYAPRGISSFTLEEVTQLRKQQRERNIPEHILGKEIKEKREAEDSVLDSIETVRADTQRTLIDSKALVSSCFDSLFTYEMLSKYDVKNGIIGLETSCCAYLASSQYGQDIVKATIIANDVQNLVVKDKRGRLIAKGTLYLNKEKGYGVFNDFEINEKYKKHEDMDYANKHGGKYCGSEKEEAEREAIFNALMRGVSAIVEEYDSQNPEHPLEKINVGMGFNRLKAQCERFRRETENLTVPAEYQFNDALKEQRVLYDRAEMLRIRGGKEQ